MQDTARTIEEVLARARAVLAESDDPEPWVAPFRTALGSFRTSEVVQWTREALRAEPPVEPHLVHAVEQWLRLARPVLPMVQRRVERMPTVYKHRVPQWSVVEPVLASVSDGVCRIENATSDVVGSGLLIASDRVLTHESVLDAITVGTGLVVAGEACVRFHVELGSPRETVTRVVRGVERGDGAGVVLQIDAAEHAVVALTRATVRVGEPVALLGYPGADSVHNPPFVGAILGRNAGVLRASVGEVRAVHDARIEHDAFATHGSVGGALISLETGALVGLHATRTFAWRAWAERV